MNTAHHDLLMQYREDIYRLATQYKASNIHIFGSVARGESDEASDIDFLVDFSADASLFDWIGFK